MAYMEKVAIRTKFEDMIDITAKVQEIVKKSGVKEGICIVHCNHTTSGLMITSFWDKRGHQDIVDTMNMLIPTRNDFHHQFDTPTEAAGRSKTAFFGTTLTLIVTGGKALLGSSQGIIFAEYDGPRDRQYFVKVIEDPS